MRRFLLVLLLTVVGLTASAETLRFRSQAYSQKTMASYGWTSWSSWESSDILITMDLNTDIVTIYSPRTQYYKIIDYSNQYYDGTTKCVDYRFYDQDGDRGTMTLAIKQNGQSEIYIRFANVQWAYIVVRI